jgi:hypothetical protein
MSRLAGLTKPDLVRGDDAVARLTQHLDGGLPGRGAEVLPVQKDSGAAVGGRWPDVHIGHLERVALGLEAEGRDWPRVLEALQLGPIDGLCAGRGSAHLCHRSQG